MKNTNKGNGAAAVILFLMLFVLVFTLGAKTGEEAGRQEERALMQLEAVKANVAHWEVNPVTGASSFHWNNVVKQP